MADRADLELIYVADPMCSWCWGFAPVIEQLVDDFDIPFRVVIGGLRPGDSAEPLNDTLRAYLWKHWVQIAELTGQPFDQANLERDGWMYDTMIADTAVVAMREQAPEETLRFFNRIQRAFYAEGVDITDPSAYRDLVSSFPVGPDAFVGSLTSETMQAAARRDFAESAAFGVAGFPSLLLRIGDTTRPVSFGYVSRDDMVSRIRGLLDRSLPAETVGAVCSIDGDLC